MEILIKDGVKFIQHTFETESQFEKIVFGQFKFIFGDKAILFDKQKIRTATGIGTIPDAFVISPDKQKWYIIEVELATHNVYQHIIPQITRFKNALDNVQTKRALTKYFDKAIEEDINKMANWFEATEDKNVTRLLSDIIDEDPELLIIIDGTNEELEIASRNLPFITRINIFKTFCREGFGLGDNIFQFDTFASSKKTLKLKPVVVNPNSSNTNYKQEREPGFKAPSPSTVEWVQTIPELANLKGLYKWTNICDYYKLKHKGNSARRVLQKWVKENKPTWKPVPDA